MIPVKTLELYVNLWGCPDCYKTIVEVTLTESNIIKLSLLEYPDNISEFELNEGCADEMIQDEIQMYEDLFNEVCNLIK